MFRAVFICVDVRVHDVMPFNLFADYFILKSYFIKSINKYVDLGLSYPESSGSLINRTRLSEVRKRKLQSKRVFSPVLAPSKSQTQPQTF